LTGEPSFDELVGADTSGAERERLRHVHELLLEAGPPPELTAKLRKAPGSEPGVVRLQQRRVVKRRGLLLLAAALSIVAVFAAGYAVSSSRQSGTSAGATGVAKTLELKGTRLAPNAQATLEVGKPLDGNWPMTLSVIGLRKLPPHVYYEVYLVRDGKPWGSCGTFRVANSSQAVTLTLNAPYKLRKGDTWVVTRPAPHDAEPGQTVLRPVSA
jgi:hypothetical protein